MSRKVNLNNLIFLFPISPFAALEHSSLEPLLAYKCDLLLYLLVMQAAQHLHKKVLPFCSQILCSFSMSSTSFIIPCSGCFCFHSTFVMFSICSSPPVLSCIRNETNITVIFVNVLRRVEDTHYTLSDLT